MGPSEDTTCEVMSGKVQPGKEEIQSKSSISRNSSAPEDFHREKGRLQISIR
jgi:hypothetical protein